MQATNHRARHRSFLIAGTGIRAARLQEAWRQAGPLDWDLVGFVGAPDSRRVAPVLGPPARLVEVIREKAVTDLLVALDDGPAEGWTAEILSALASGVRVSPMSSFFERLTGRAWEAHGQETWESFLGSGVHGRFFATAKRLVDLSVGAVGVFFFVLLLPPIAAAIKLESPGPLFLREEFVGRYGRRFWRISFRTERADNAGQGRPGLMPVSADRSTRVGRRLRRFGLHRLPVFVNLLRGEMSLVGPRAQSGEAAARLAREMPCSAGRLLARPGLVGWAQLQAGRDIRFGADAMRRLEYDLYYVRRASLGLELRIALESAGAALGLRLFR